jgi:23S rRNA pseudouridine1911/1915/1917 synthase
MPSQNMLPKGKRRQSVKNDYRAQRTLIQEQEAARLAGGESPEHAHIMESVDTAGFTPKPSPFAHMPGLVTSGPSGGKHPQEAADLTPRRYPAPTPEVEPLDDLEPEDGVRTFTAAAAAANMRLDAYLAKAIPDISRARVQLLTENGQVTVDGKPGKSKQKLKGGEVIEIEGEPQPAPLHATAEDIPLNLVYEDADLAVIDKPAGMMVHAGSGAPEHNTGTLVNALLHHFGTTSKKPSSFVGDGLQPVHTLHSEEQGASAPEGISTPALSSIGGALRPGIVHRLDKQTSGLIVVAKNDVTHRKLAEMFSARTLSKTYLALVHGHIAPSASADPDEGTISLPIARDLVRRIRMTTRRADGRSAISHWTVLDRLKTAYGPFTLVEVRIETGRTHQIRVHMQAIGHPVVGDFLYGAPHLIQPLDKFNPTGPLELERNFLHAAELELDHPRTGQPLHLTSPLPPELTAFLTSLH